MLHIFNDIGTAWTWCTKSEDGYALVAYEQPSNRVAFVSKSIRHILNNFIFEDSEIILNSLNGAIKVYPNCMECECLISITNDYNRHTLWINKKYLINHAIGELREHVLFNLPEYC